MKKDIVKLGKQKAVVVELLLDQSNFIVDNNEPLVIVTYKGLIHQDVYKSIVESGNVQVNFQVVMKE